VTEKTLKIADKLVFLTHAIRHTLKSLTKNCRGIQKSLTETQKEFWKGCSCTDPTFCCKLL